VHATYNMAEFSLELFKKDIKQVEEDFASTLRSLRTGRAKVETFNGVKVEAYGMENQLNAVANVVIESALSVIIVPYDKGVANDIMQGLSDADLGFTPINEGDKIRINIPPMTEETRKQTVKDMYGLMEEARIRVRQIRQKAMDRIEKMEGFSEDEQERSKKQVQTEVDGINERLQEMAEQKETEIMSI